MTLPRRHMTGSIRRADEQQRARDVKRRRAIERECGLPRHALGDYGDEHAEIADVPPPGWARSER